MPLDQTNYQVKIAPLQTGLAGLKQIGDALWWSIPPNFRWVFSELLEEEDDQCGSYGCATGLAHILWPETVTLPTYLAVADALDLPQGDMQPIFGCGGADPGPYDGLGKLLKDITPHDVADAIDCYIAGKGGINA